MSARIDYSMPSERMSYEQLATIALTIKPFVELKFTFCVLLLTFSHLILLAIMFDVVKAQLATAAEKLAHLRRFL